MYFRSSHMFSKKYQHNKQNQGFSLVELLITSAIITIVTAIVIIKHASFNNAVLLNNQAYEIALAIREAQMFAVSARGESSDFRERYGAYFNKSNANSQEVIIYIESEDSGNDSKRYNEGDDSILETLVLDSRFKIDDICAPDGSRDNCNRSAVSLSFKRPDFDPILNPTGVAASTVNMIEIVVVPVNGSSFSRVIEITKAGQISVKKP